MRVEDLNVERVGDDVVRSVRLSWVGGETRLWVRAPAAYAPADDDLSPFVPVATMLAMKRSEPLQLDGPVSPRLMTQLPEAQQLLSAWDPGLTRVPVRAARALDPGPPRPGHGCGFSRGVDSTYSAIAPRHPSERLTTLVFSTGWDPGDSVGTERELVDAARRAAAVVGLDVIVVGTNVREVMWRVLDWIDAHGATLAMLGLSLPGAFGRFTLASNVDHGNFLPRGSHPQLDPLWSTERVEVAHDSAALGRAGKLAHIVQARPELLDHLFVCFGGDSATNCGSCSKCLLTLACLQAAGGGGRSAAFPKHVDLDAVRALALPPLVTRLGWNSALAALEPTPENEPLRDAIAELLRNSSRVPLNPGPSTIAVHQERLLRAISAGDPYPPRAAGPEFPSAEIRELDGSWPPPRDVPEGRIGLLVTVDEDERRHAYGAGVVPPGTFIGELGALLAGEPHEGGVPLLLDEAGTPMLADGSRARSRRQAARWVMSPLRWRDLAGPVPRARSVARRSRDALRGRREPEANGTRVAGWLHRDGGPGRLALFAASHPALPDVLLTTEPHEPVALGYGEPELLGYLEDHAPATGRRGIARPALRWTRRWGQGATSLPSRL